MLDTTRTPKIMDFGLAKRDTGEVTITDVKVDGPGPDGAPVFGEPFSIRLSLAAAPGTAPPTLGIFRVVEAGRHVERRPRRGIGPTQGRDLGERGLRGTRVVAAARAGESALLPSEGPPRRPATARP